MDSKLLYFLIRAAVSRNVFRETTYRELAQTLTLNIQRNYSDGETTMRSASGAFGERGNKLIFTLGFDHEGNTAPRLLTVRGHETNDTQLALAFMAIAEYLIDHGCLADHYDDFLRLPNTKARGETVLEKHVRRKRQGREYIKWLECDIARKRARFAA
ncbi:MULTISPECIES: hypothetical protein [Paraburkholderia]|uniref:hypothetical protein n=1 Tax=Paraburkholderia TaxID=1822464 RepID=UPI002256FDBA|nr:MULTISPECIES: hypothetical protein [Paraburkholderia]MCX4170698.1 hypothetical protein [Paraburkholderia madseniana]MDQ6458710.1 hypothetical protein [Paraburkholderia madseniana]